MDHMHMILMFLFGIAMSILFGWICFREPLCHMMAKGSRDKTMISKFVPNWEFGLIPRIATAKHHMMLNCPMISRAIEMVDMVIQFMFMIIIIIRFIIVIIMIFRRVFVSSLQMLVMLRIILEL